MYKQFTLEVVRGVKQGRNENQLRMPCCRSPSHRATIKTSDLGRGWQRGKPSPSTTSSQGGGNSPCIARCASESARGSLRLSHPSASLRKSPGQGLRCQFQARWGGAVEKPCAGSCSQPVSGRERWKANRMGSGNQEMS